MRRKITIVALGLGLAASFAPLSPASAVCNSTWQSLTGDCNPCYTSRRILGFPQICLD